MHKMKLFLLSVGALLCTLTAGAQTILMGDMNGDSTLSVADVTQLVNCVKKDSTVHITLDSPSGYDAQNDKIVGVWTSPTEGSIGFNADSTCTIGTNCTYRFMPLQGRILVYDESGTLSQILNAYELTTDYIIVGPQGSDTFHYYYKGTAVSGITLSQTEFKGAIGETLQLTATMEPADAAIQVLTWKSANTSIATVSETGLVTIVGKGSTTVTASAVDGSGMTATCKVAGPTPVTGITLSATNMTVIMGTTATLTATVLPADADDPTTTWTSSSEGVATVSTSGLITPVSTGRTTITIAAQDGTGIQTQCVVNVVPALSTAVHNSHTYVDLGVTDSDGNTVYFATTNIGGTNPQDYGDWFNYFSMWSYLGGRRDFRSAQSLEGSSSQGAVVPDTYYALETDHAQQKWGGDWRVPSNDEFNSLTSACTWTWTQLEGVNGRLGQASNGNWIFLPAAGSREEASAVHYGAGTKGEYWTNWGRQGWNARVYHVEAGGAYIMMKDYGLGSSVRPVFRSSASDVEDVMVTSISLDNTRISLEKGGTATLTATVLPTDAYNQSLQWTTDNASIATVSGGVVTAVGYGGTWIYATSSDGTNVHASCYVGVSDSTRVTGLSLHQTTLNMGIGSTYTLQPTVTPSSAADKTVLWTSSDESVATVSSSGVVTGVAAGTATITATSNARSTVTATCAVTIVAATDGHTYTALGLPSGTLWADMNYGATSAEDYGLYFSWGESGAFGQENTDNVTNYNYCHSYVKKNYQYFNNYQWLQGSQPQSVQISPVSSEATLSQYYVLSDMNSISTLNTLRSDCDPAYTNWGQSWSIPTPAQMMELLNTDYTTLTWTQQNGVTGLLVTSKVTGYEGNSIFLPAAGLADGDGTTSDDDAFEDVGEGVFYWTNCLTDANVTNTNVFRAMCLAYNPTDRDADLTRLSAYPRCWGLTFRPVFTPSR